MNGNSDVLRRQRQSLIGGLVVLLLTAGCSQSPQAPPPRKVNLYQTWNLQPGDQLAGYQIQSGLGDIVLALNGHPVYMPFSGQVAADADRPDLCVVISSPEVPAYLFRLCGIHKPRLGDRKQGESVGRADGLAVATLRRQTDGTWAMVEPAKDLLEQFVSRP